MEWWQFVFSTVGGGLLSQLGRLSIDWKKAKSEVELSKDSQDFNQEQIVFADLRARILALETAHSQCTAHSIEQAKQIGHLAGLLEAQDKRMSYLNQITEIRNRVSPTSTPEPA